MLGAATACENADAALKIPPGHGFSSLPWSSRGRLFLWKVHGAAKPAGGAVLISPYAPIHLYKPPDGVISPHFPRVE
jgi:hypothetical protein